MRTSLVGRIRRQSGITLIEMLLVVAIVSLMAGLAFPAVSAGIDAVRLRSACDGLAAFLNYGMTWCERRQEAVFLIVPGDRTVLRLRGLTPTPVREFVCPSGVKISAVLPESDPGQDRIIPLMPGAPFPGLTFELVNQRGARRLVRIDPMEGVPQVLAP